MKEKFKIGDIVKYKGMGLFSNGLYDVRIIGYIIDASITNITIYEIVILKVEDKECSFQNGQIICIDDCFGSLIKLY